jgi:chaperonin cofactor prefoldin
MNSPQSSIRSEEFQNISDPDEPIYRKLGPLLTDSLSADAYTKAARVSPAERRMNFYTNTWERQLKHHQKQEFQGYCGTITVRQKL